MDRETSHSLRGLCGLKSYRINQARISRGSQPARAVWIEIGRLLRSISASKSHSLRGLCGLK